MKTISITAIDDLVATLKTLRTQVAALESTEKRFQDANGGYLAAKAGARQAMDDDDFDKLNGFNLAMKRHHKLAEDLRDRKTDLAEAIDRLLTTAERQLLGPEPTWHTIAAPAETTETNMEDAA